MIGVMEEMTEGKVVEDQGVDQEAEVRTGVEVEAEKEGEGGARVEKDGEVEAEKDIEEGIVHLYHRSQRGTSWKRFCLYCCKV